MKAARFCEAHEPIPAQPETGCPMCEAVHQADLYRRAMLALESLTPSGSEYVGDHERCVAHVREQQTHLTDLLKKTIRAKREAEAENKKLRESNEHWGKSPRIWHRCKNGHICTYEAVLCSRDRYGEGKDFDALVEFRALEAKVKRLRECMLTPGQLRKLADVLLIYAPRTTAMGFPALILRDKASALEDFEKAPCREGGTG